MDSDNDVFDFLAVLGFFGVGLCVVGFAVLGVFCFFNHGGV